MSEHRITPLKHLVLEHEAEITMQLQFAIIVSLVKEKKELKRLLKHLLNCMKEMTRNDSRQ